MTVLKPAAFGAGVVSPARRNDGFAAGDSGRQLIILDIRK
jgi:hypothetical protein